MRSSGSTLPIFAAAGILQASGPNMDTTVVFLAIDQKLYVGKLCVVASFILLSLELLCPLYAVKRIASILDQGHREYSR